MWQEKLGALKDNLVEKRRNRLYEAYLWESQYDLTPVHNLAIKELEEISSHNVEDRLFEDPLYLMQYNILSQDPYDSQRSECVENAAFITAENEVYLRKVWTSTYKNSCASSFRPSLKHLRP